MIFISFSHSHVSPPTQPLSTLFMYLIYELHFPVGKEHLGKL